MSLIESLFATPTPADLGPRVRSGIWSVEEIRTQTTQTFKEARIPGQHAECLRALVLLWHDHLDAAHQMVQALAGADAAFVHGILHRREPDFSNARYWFQRASDHPVIESLAEAVAPILAAHAALPYRLIREGRWDPLAFVDAVSVASREPNSAPQVALLRELQRQETLAMAGCLATG